MTEWENIFWLFWHWRSLSNEDDSLFKLNHFASYQKNQQLWTKDQKQQFSLIEIVKATPRNNALIELVDQFMSLCNLDQLLSISIGVSDLFDAI